MTPAEEHLWQHLRAHRLDGHHFRRQQPIGPSIVDCFCAAGRLVVEVGGAIHAERVEYDRERDAYLAAHALTVRRFTNDTVLHDTARVLAAIRHTLNTSPAHPPASRYGHIQSRAEDG